MKNSAIRQTLFPILAAFIWGTAFIFQSVGSQYLETFTYNASRALVASISLGLILVLFPSLRTPCPAGITKHKNFNNLVVGGISCGVALTAASNFQQLGIAGTTVGKAGFITALYIVIVPILGIFLGKKNSIKIWGSVALAVFGLYFLCIEPGSSLSIAPGDFYVILCAVCFAVHILLIEHFTKTCGGVELSFVQFIVTTILSGIGSFLFETVSIDALIQCLPSILYVGIFSSGVAYTLQILSLRGANPTVVSLLLSLESVFAALAGAIYLHERMNIFELSGCLLMLAGVIWAQLPQRRPLKKSH